MARRAARNREVLGVHYPSDTRFGFRLAARCLPLFLQCPTVRGVSNTVDGQERQQAAVKIFGITTEPAAPTLLTAGTQDIFNDRLLARARSEWV